LPSVVSASKSSTISPRFIFDVYLFCNKKGFFVKIVEPMSLLTYRIIILLILFLILSRARVLQPSTDDEVNWIWIG